MSLVIKTGAVKFTADRIFDNPFEPGQQQQNIVCTMDDGTEEKLYFQAYRKPHAVLQRGERIQIIFETNEQTGKTKRRLVVENQEQIMQRQVQQRQKAEPYVPIQNRSNQQQNFSPKQSADLFIAERLAIYNEVLDRVNHCKFTIELNDSDKSDIATSILIEGSRNNVNFRELLVSQDHIVPNQLEEQSLPKTVSVKPLPEQTSFEVQLDEMPF